MALTGDWITSKPADTFADSLPPLPQEGAEVPRSPAAPADHPDAAGRPQPVTAITRALLTAMAPPVSIAVQVGRHSPDTGRWAAPAPLPCPPSSSALRTELEAPRGRGLGRQQGKKNGEKGRRAVSAGGSPAAHGHLRPHRGATAPPGRGPGTAPRDGRPSEGEHGN